MNNMTTKEKARCYDEAIEKARIWKNKSGMPKDKQSILDDIFPELKESREDEIIRVIKEVILNSVPYKINILTKDTTITAEEAIAWSEEDERMFAYALDMVEWYSGKNESKSRTVSDWLKSLKERVLPQSKQEWSKKDINFIEATIGLLNLVTPIDAVSWGKSRLDCIDWLKSLRPQSQWKPSERDLGSLKDAIIHYEGIGIKPNGLKELLEQLKKLRKE